MLQNLEVYAYNQTIGKLAIFKNKVPGQYITFSHSGSMWIPIKFGTMGQVPLMHRPLLRHLKLEQGNLTITLRGGGG